MTAPLLTPAEAGGAIGPDRHALAGHGLRTTRRRRHRRRLAVTGVLAALAAALSVTALMLGDYRLSAAEVLRALAGADDGAASFIVLELRLPRLVLGILVGIAFGLAGALFQSVLRNPLASPDVIGISQGASAGAVVALLAVGATSGLAVPLSALAGGALVGLLLYLVAWRGGMTGHRFVLAGIGVAYVCTSVIGYLLTRSDVKEAQLALLWMTGSLGQADWSLVRTLGTAVAVLVPPVALVARSLALLLLGDEQAGSLGLRPEVTRACVVALGVALACVATAAAGPVAFVAFTAAPVARRLLGDGSLALAQAALVAVVLVVGADIVAQHLLPADLSVPVGVVTGAVGGPYLIWLMASGRSRTA